MRRYLDDVIEQPLCLVVSAQSNVKLHQCLKDMAVARIQLRGFFPISQRLLPFALFKLTIGRGQLLETPPIFANDVAARREQFWLGTKRYRFLARSRFAIGNRKSKIGN